MTDKRAMNRLGGWWRLWVVVSVVLGIMTWLVASRANDVSGYETEMSEQQARAWVNQAKLDTKACDLAGEPDVSASSDSSGLFSGSYYCTSDRQYLLSFIYALIPGALLAALGLTARWVYQGFRRR